MYDNNKRRYFYDDGTEFKPVLVPTPDLCVTCTHNNRPDQEVLCNLTRADGQDEEIFICFAYEPMSANIDKETVLRDLCERAGLEYPEHSVEMDGGDSDSVPF